MATDNSRTFEEYYTHDNGTYAFCVNLFPSADTAHLVEIYSVKWVSTETFSLSRDGEVNILKVRTKDELIMRIENPKKIFIGKNIEYGVVYSFHEDQPEENNGNSILIALEEPGNYVCVAEKIFQFTTAPRAEEPEADDPEADVDTSDDSSYESETDYYGEVISPVGIKLTKYSEIVEYYSPLNYSDCSYPHAIDKDGAAYLLNCHIKILPGWEPDKETGNKSPYTYFYKNKQIKKRVVYNVDGKRRNFDASTKIPNPGKSNHHIVITKNRKRITTNEARQIIEQRRSELGIEYYKRHTLIPRPSYEKVESSYY